MFDVAIIGAGPVGLFAAFQAGLMGLNACVIDVLDFVGGQCTALYPEKPIYDIPACPAILAEDLISKLESQASVFKPKFFLGQAVTGVERRGEAEGFVLETKQQGSPACKDSTSLNQIQAKAVIIAAGAGAFNPNKPPIPGLAAFEGKSVFYTVNKKDLFRDKDVVIFGGGDSAVDWALLLPDVAKSVCLVHRRDKFRCLPESSQKLCELAQCGKISMQIPYQICGIEGENGQLHSIHVEDLAGQRKTLQADAALLFFGLAMELGPIANWGLELDKKHIRVDQATMSTNVPGIFGAGDIITYPGKLKLILTGFAEAALACRSIHSYLNPGKPVSFEHSTSKGDLFK